MFNPNVVKRSLEVSLARARAAVETAPAPLCPDHPEYRAIKLHITHPDTVIPYKVAFRMGCDIDVEALKFAGYRVEVL